MRASLSVPMSQRAASPGGAPPPLLARRGADVILGESALGASVAPSRTTMFGPRGAHLFGDDGPLWVCDTGHHRLLGFAKAPSADGAPADWVIGQPSFASEGRNGKGPTSASTVNVPTGIAPVGDGFAVADAWNNRVLVWRTMPAGDGVPADLVLGQADFTGDAPNRGLAAPAADTLHWPSAVLVVGGALVVADTGNRRLLVWDRLPDAHGAPADRVLGQPDFASRSDNGGGDATAASFRWPHALVWQDGLFVVADAGNSRLLVFRGLPRHGGEPAIAIVGQERATDTDHNQGRYWPTASSLNMPYGVAGAGDGELVVCDTASSRVLGFSDLLASGGRHARRLSAQPSFETKGDNRWSMPARDSVCWPYGVQVHRRVDGRRLAVIADSGNNRVLLWELEESRR
ncbi:MAG: hypothetical protein KF795_14735 [Labilithrix sp.]|nr:hypothetical protein [Labilithrix sp.]